jgi:hypothetical protein
MILFPISQNKRIEPESLRPKDHLTQVSCRNYEKFDESIVNDNPYSQHRKRGVLEHEFFGKTVSIRLDTRLWMEEIRS